MKKDIFEQIIEPLGKEKPKGRGPAKTLINEVERSMQWRAHPTEKLCKDCNKVVLDRTINFIIKETRNGEVHWIKRCNVCLLRTPAKLPNDLK